MAFIFFLAFSLLLNGALGNLVCEQLPTELCSFSISTNGKRCILENFATKEGKIKFQCKTSEVVVDIMKEWIETDECISVCGVDRNTIGISSDYLLQPKFLAKLCSSPCYFNCPNIVDLYYNLALAEGNFLPRICTDPHRALFEIKSSGEAALGPSTAPAQAPCTTMDLASAPAPST